MGKFLLYKLKLRYRKVPPNHRDTT